MNELQKNDVLNQSNILPFLAKPVVQNANIQQRRNHFHFSKHIHDTLEIYLITSGQCSMEIGSQAIHCLTGDFVLILSNIPHSFYLNEEESCEFKHIHFGKEVLLELSIQNNHSHYISLLNALEFATTYGTKSFHFPADDFLNETITKIIAENQRESEFKYYFINLYLLELLFHILEVQKIDFSTYTPKHEVQNGYVNFTLEYIERNYDKKMRIEEISSELKISACYLRRVFSNCMHINISNYLQIYRINKAIELMMSTELSMTQIAVSIGMNDGQQFSKVFRNVIGATPLQYRRLMRKQEA